MFKSKIYQLINIIILKLFFYILLITGLSIFLYYSYSQIQHSKLKINEANSILADVKYKIDIISSRPDLLYNANNIINEIIKYPAEVACINKDKIDKKISLIRQQYNSPINVSYSSAHVKEDNYLKSFVSLKTTYINLKFFTDTFENFVNISKDIYNDFSPNLQVLYLYCNKDRVLNSKNIENFLKDKVPNFISADIDLSLNEIRVNK